MQVVLTEEEYNLLKAKSLPEDTIKALADAEFKRVVEKFERMLFPFITELCKNAQTYAKHDPEKFFHLVSKAWNNVKTEAKKQ